MPNTRRLLALARRCAAAHRRRALCTNMAAKDVVVCEVVNQDSSSMICTMVIGPAWAANSTTVMLGVPRMRQRLWYLLRTWNIVSHETALVHAPSPTMIIAVTPVDESIGPPDIPLAETISRWRLEISIPPTEPAFSVETTPPGDKSGMRLHSIGTPGKRSTGWACPIPIILSPLTNVGSKVRCGMFRSPRTFNRTTSDIECWSVFKIAG